MSTFTTPDEFRAHMLPLLEYKSSQMIVGKDKLEVPRQDDDPDGPGIARADKPLAPVRADFPSLKAIAAPVGPDGASALARAIATAAARPSARADSSALPAVLTGGPVQIPTEWTEPEIAKWFFGDGQEDNFEEKKDGEDEEEEQGQQKEVRPEDSNTALRWVLAQAAKPENAPAAAAYDVLIAGFVRFAIRRAKARKLEDDATPKWGETRLFYRGPITPRVFFDPEYRTWWAVGKAFVEYDCDRISYRQQQQPVSTGEGTAADWLEEGKRVIDVVRRAVYMAGWLEGNILPLEAESPAEFKDVVGFLDQFTDLLKVNRHTCWQPDEYYFDIDE